MADDLQFSAGIDDSGFTEGTKRMDASAKAFAGGFKKEMKELDAVLKNTVSKGTQEFSKLQLSAQRAMNAGTGKGGGMAGRGNTANAAYQLQDIAVQMQMGAKATTIIAQQVPQLLGPTYAVAGAAVALGGALIAAGQASTEAFKAIVKGADDAGQALRKVDQTDLHGLIQGFDEAQKKMDELGQTRRTGVSGFLANGVEALSGGSPLQRDRQRAESEMKLANEMGDAQDRAKQGAQQLLRIEQLKAQGKNEEADALKKEIELNKTLYAIEKSGFDESTKAQLSETARTMAAIRDETEEKKAAEEANKRMDTLAAQTKKVNEEMSGEEPVKKLQRLAMELQTINELRDKEGKTSGEASMKRGLQAAEKRLEISKELQAQSQKATSDGEKDIQQKERSKKIAENIFDKARALTALAEKGLHGLFDQYGLEAQTKELAKQYLTAQKIQAQADVKKADDLLDPQGARDRKRKERREFIADRTIAEREINKLDRENGGLPGHHRLSPAERKAAVDARVRRAQAERNGKTKVSLDEADVVKLAAAMMVAAAQQNAK